MYQLLIQLDDSLSPQLTLSCTISPPSLKGSWVLQLRVGCVGSEEDARIVCPTVRFPEARERHGEYLSLAERQGSQKLTGVTSEVAKHAFPNACHRLKRSCQQSRWKIGQG